MKVPIAILIVLAALAFVVFPVEAGDGGTISAGDYTAEVGEDVTVVLQAVDIPKPGLGAWTIDVIYDSAIVHATGCSSEQGGVCSPAFADDTVRATGAVVTEGLTGTFPLATFTFACDAVGTSELEVDEVLFTTAEPQLEIDDLSLDNGSIACEEAGQDGVIRIGSNSGAVGEEVTVTLEAVDVPPPGLGAWQVDVSYDASVVSLLDCEPRPGGICNLEYEDHTLRVAGASAAGLPGFPLADIVFECSRAGTTDLEVSATFYGTSLPEDTPSFPDPVSGTITCTDLPAELPSTGGGDPQPASSPATVPLAVLGVVLLAVAFRFRRYASPR